VKQRKGMLLSAHDINEYPDYPGRYIPLPETEQLLQALHPGVVGAGTPLLNMDEFDECYKLVIVIPGAKREEVLVHIQDNILSVAAAHKADIAAGKRTAFHEFETTCFERHILLPKDADAAFIIAAFSGGLLNLYIPKSEDMVPVSFRQVVVY
jgi:HSP20 family protein